MTRARLAAAAASTLALVIAAGDAGAERRSFTRTYEYLTLPARHTELELYTTQARATFDGETSPQAFELAFAVEHGLTDRWDVSLFHTFTQASDGGGTSSGLAFSRVALRTRFRLAERGSLPVDSVLIAEAGKDFGRGVYALHGRWALSRDVGPVTAVVNLLVDGAVGNDVDEATLDLGWSAGLTYEVLPRWRVGAEGWGDVVRDDDGEPAASAGPALSWAPTTSLWIAATAGFGLTDAADAFSARAILGLSL
jgi:hypothetical protein